MGEKREVNTKMSRNSTLNTEQRGVKRYSQMSRNSRLTMEHPLIEDKEEDDSNSGEEERKSIFSTEKKTFIIGNHRLTIEQLNDEQEEGSIFTTSRTQPVEQPRSSSFTGRPSSFSKTKENNSGLYHCRNSVFSASFPREKVTNEKNNEIINKPKFKVIAHTITQSLLSLMEIESRRRSTGLTSKHLCSGTINGRGSFVHVRDRQSKFENQDCFEVSGTEQ